jgi:hypothetical protein
MASGCDRSVWRNALYIRPKCNRAGRMIQFDRMPRPTERRRMPLNLPSGAAAWHPLTFRSSPLRTSLCSPYFPAADVEPPLRYLHGMPQAKYIAKEWRTSELLDVIFERNRQAHRQSPLKASVTDCPPQYYPRQSAIRMISFTAALPAKADTASTIADLVKKGHMDSLTASRW